MSTTFRAFNASQNAFLPFSSAVWTHRMPCRSEESAFTQCSSLRTHNYHHLRRSSVISMAVVVPSLMMVFVDVCGHIQMLEGFPFRVARIPVQHYPIPRTLHNAQILLVSWLGYVYRCYQYMSHTITHILGIVCIFSKYSSTQP